MKKKEKIKKLKEEVASLKCRLLALEGIIDEPVYWECVHDDGNGFTEGEIYREVYKVGNRISLKDDTGNLARWYFKDEKVTYQGCTYFRKVTNKETEPKEQPTYWECVNDDGYGYTEGEIYEEIPKEGNLISLKDDAGRLIPWTVKGEDIFHYGRTCFRKVI
jgi:hypothetical protein